ncbi:hypothetical protein AQF52_6594 [Streptomyces venezuelae]|nr:hypothetical protein AQF52_6594 [Streptomyces venezuelae]CUM37233.1 Transporter [Streptomyces venezuelae]
MRRSAAPHPPVDGRLGALAAVVDEVLLGLGDGITRVERKQYRAYQRLRNFACVCPPQKTKLLVYLRADPSAVDLIPGFTRDGTGLGHHGAGDLEVQRGNERDVADVRAAEIAADDVRLALTSAEEATCFRGEFGLEPAIGYGAWGVGALALVYACARTGPAPLGGSGVGTHGVTHEPQATRVSSRWPAVRSRLARRRRCRTPRVLFPSRPSLRRGQMAKRVLDRIHAETVRAPAPRPSGGGTGCVAERAERHR